VALGLTACSRPANPDPARTATANSSFVSVNGADLYYETLGEGPAIVLLHGGGLDRRVWDPQFALLAADHRVIRYDIRPFGKSKPPVQPYSDVEDGGTHRRIEESGHPSRGACRQSGRAGRVQSGGVPVSECYCNTTMKKGWTSE
jgi:hypothetical protein